MAERVRVLVADDSAFVRRAVERMLAAVPQIEVVGSAASGRDAVRLAKELRPDVIVLDVNMPEVDGLEALSQIMREAPTGVLMLSTLTRQGARTTVRALELGAVDFIDKTSAGTAMDIYSLAPALREKVLTVAGAALPAPEQAAEPAEEIAPAPRPGPPPAATCPYEVLVIGASTGGPRALAEVVPHLPEGLGAGVVIAQHMPPGFTQTLADRLNRRCALEVTEGCDDDRIEPGRVLVAPGGTQVTLARAASGLVLRVDAGPTTLIHRPSVDLLFRSTAEVVGSRAVGVVLTGMGDDGARGLEALRDAGARTVAESEQSAVIFGMPRAAAPAAERVLPLTQVGPYLAELCSTSTAERRR